MKKIIFILILFLIFLLSSFAFADEKVYTKTQVDSLIKKQAIKIDSLSDIVKRTEIHKEYFGYTLSIFTVIVTFIIVISVFLGGFLSFKRIETMVQNKISQQEETFFSFKNKILDHSKKTVSMLNFTQNRIDITNFKTSLRSKEFMDAFYYALKLSHDCLDQKDIDSSINHMESALTSLEKIFIHFNKTQRTNIKKEYSEIIESVESMISKVIEFDNDTLKQKTKKVKDKFYNILYTH